MSDNNNVQLPLSDNDPNTIDIVVGSGDADSPYGYRELRLRFPADITCNEFINNICRPLALSIGYVEESFNRALVELAQENGLAPQCNNCPCGDTNEEVLFTFTRI